MLSSTNNATPYNDDVASPNAFTEQQIDAIYDLLNSLYMNSPSAKELFDSIVTTDQTLTIYQTVAGFVGNTPKLQNSPERYTGINLSAAGDATYINPYGEVVIADTRLVLVHEIYHALTGAEDPQGGPNRGLPGSLQNPPPNTSPNPSFDFAGQTVALQNIVAHEITSGTLSNEISYNAVAYPGSFSAQFLTAGKSYTFGFEIDVAIVQQNSSMVQMDFAGYTKNGIHVDTLLIAFSGDTFLGSGHGNDFLYGGTGNDILSPAGGSNWVDGGTGTNTLTMKDGPSVVGYTVNLTNGEIYARDGSGDSTLFDNIKIVEGSNYSDLFYFSEGKNSNGGNGNDTLSFELYNGPVYFNMTSGQLIAGGQAHVAFNFENVIFNPNSPNPQTVFGRSEESQDNFVWGSEGNNLITTTNGNDTIYSGGGDDVISAGGGDDTIHLEGNGSSLLHYAFGDGNDTVFGFKEGQDSFVFHGISGMQNPTVDLVLHDGSTDLQIRWYAEASTPEVPEFVEAHITLADVSLTHVNYLLV
jgi:Ca2+-binding RTX toxin-like protein